MGERNIDKLRRLEKELEGWRERLKDQSREMARLRRTVRDREQGAGELQQVVDAWLIALVRKYGVQVGEDAYEASIPAVELGSLEVWGLEIQSVQGEYRLRVNRR